MASSENLCLKAFIYHMMYRYLRKPKCLLIVFVRCLKCVQFKSNYADLQIANAGVSKLGTNVIGYQSIFSIEVDPIFFL